jgi:hypothetical protein
MPPVGQQASKLQGERIETPAFIREKGLTIDVKFYMEHQLMNPLSQLFDPIVEQLPGCVAPGGRSWAKADASDREYAATEYLFRDALNLCDKNAERRFATLFGANTGAAATAAAGAAAHTRQSTRRPTAGAAAQKKPAIEPRKYVQTRLQVPSISAQSAMLKELEKTLPRRSPRIASSASPKDN